MRFVIALAVLTTLAAVEASAGTRFATSKDGTRIAFDVTGSGPGVILLHGGGQTRRVWHDLGYVKRLSGEFLVVAIDLRGNGESDKPTRTAAYADLNVVRFERYDALGPLGDRIPGLAGLRDHRGFAYTMPRGRGARTYLLAARDTEAIIDLIERLAGMEVLPSEGFLFSLD